MSLLYTSISFPVTESAACVQDQQELQQAAAAIARLTPPSMPVMQEQADEMNKAKQQTPDSSVPSAAQQLKELEARVQQAGMDAMTFGSDSEDDSGWRGRSDNVR